MWCVKRLRVVSWLVVGRRGLHLGSWRAGSGCGGGPGRERPGYDACPGLVCAGSRPGRRGRSAGEAKAEGNMARLSLLLPPGETHLAVDR